MPTLYLIDASVYIFRGYFSLPPGLVDRAGEPANAVHGFGMFLCELLERRNPGHVAVAFDEALGSSFRHRLYPAYKAHRPPAPPDLKRQFQRCRQLAAALGVAGFASSCHEADDLIATLARIGRRGGHDMVYVSADKDLAQLVEGRDRWWDPGRGHSYDEAGVREALGVRPAQVPDLLALAGDAVDNIPGVPGIGRKAAAVLLQRFADLDALYAGLAEVEALPLRGAARVRRLLEQHEAQARLSRRLATLDAGAPLPVAPADLVWRGADADALAALGLPSALARRAVRLRFRTLERET